MGKRKKGEGDSSEGGAGKNQEGRPALCGGAFPWLGSGWVAQVAGYEPGAAEAQGMAPIEMFKGLVPLGPIGKYGHGFNSIFGVL